MEDASVLFATLETRGEAQVRIELAQSIWSEPRTVALIREWLALKDRDRSAENSARRDSREEETLAIAKEALSSAKEANRLASAANDIACREAAAASRSARYAMYAAAIAATGAISANKAEILRMIFG